MFKSLFATLKTISAVFGALTVIGSTILLVWGYIDREIVGDFLAEKIAEKNTPLIIEAVNENMPTALSLALINEDIRVRLDTNQILLIQTWIAEAIATQDSKFPLSFDNRMAVWITAEYPIYDGFTDRITGYARGIKVGGVWRIVEVSVEEYNKEKEKK